MARPVDRNRENAPYLYNRRDDLEMDYIHNMLRSISQTFGQTLVSAGTILTSLASNIESGHLEAPENVYYLIHRGLASEGAEIISPTHPVCIQTPDSDDGSVPRYDKGGLAQVVQTLRRMEQSLKVLMEVYRVCEPIWKGMRVCKEMAEADLQSFPGDNPEERRDARRRSGYLGMGAVHALEQKESLSILGGMIEGRLGKFPTH